MNQLERDAMDEYRREGPPPPMTWKHWVILVIIGTFAYIFATGLKTILS